MVNPTLVRGKKQKKTKKQLEEPKHRGARLKRRRDAMCDPSGAKKKPSITIREMDLDDLPTVFHLGEQLFTSEDVPNLYRSWDEYEVVGLYYDDAEYCFVAEQDGRIVGFVLGTTITKYRSAWKYGYLVWMGVDPRAQRLGVGERLFDDFLDAMLEAGVRMLLIDTEADNAPAIKFFNRMGFGNAEDHVYLTMNLSEQQRKYKEKREP